jgi:hypothetical protein
VPAGGPSSRQRDDGDQPPVGDPERAEQPQLGLDASIALSNRGRSPQSSVWSDDELECDQVLLAGEREPALDPHRLGVGLDPAAAELDRAPLTRSTCACHPASTRAHTPHPGGAVLVIVGDLQVGAGASKCAVIDKSAGRLATRARVACAADRARDADPGPGWPSRDFLLQLQVEPGVRCCNRPKSRSETQTPGFEQQEPRSPKRSGCRSPRKEQRRPGVAGAPRKRSHLGLRPARGLRAPGRR